MNKKGNFFRAHKFTLTLTIFILISLFIISQELTSQKVFAPFTPLITYPFSLFSKAFSKIETFITKKWVAFSSNKALWSENKFLKEKILELKLQNTLLKNALKEVSEIRKLLSFPNENTPFALARVISGGFTKWEAEIVVDKGLQDGIRKNAPVIAEQGLVGKVSRVFLSSSVVQLLTSPYSKVSAFIEPSRVQGIIQGKRGSEDLILKYIPKEENVSVGDKVLTLGITKIFPKGLLIGRIIKVKRDRRELFLKIEVKPEVNFRKLDKVIILKNN
jgi:rod shape-determining protein MreC